MQLEETQCDGPTRRESLVDPGSMAGWVGVRRREKLTRLVSQPSVGHDHLEVRTRRIPAEYLSSQFVARDGGRRIAWAPRTVANLEILACDSLYRLDDLAI